jgi:hypothetical protein
MKEVGQVFFILRAPLSTLLISPLNIFQTILSFLALPYHLPFPLPLPPLSFSFSRGGAAGRSCRARGKGRRGRQSSEARGRVVAGAAGLGNAAARQFEFA